MNLPLRLVMYVTATAATDACRLASREPLQYIGARLAAVAICGGVRVLPDTENADVGGVHDADEKPGNSGGVVGAVPGSVGEVPD